MNVKWIIDDYENGIQVLVDEIRKQGHTCDFVSYYDLLADPNALDSNGLPKNKANFNEEDCVIFQGSIQTAQWLLRNRKWIPTAWLTAENYKCSKYYPTLSKFLFNDKYVLLPKGEILRNLDWLNEILGSYDCLFMRPDSGLKSFAGKVFELERFEKDWAWVDGYVDPSDLILISNPKNIEEEFRFICKRGEIITGSKYKSNHVLDVSTLITPRAKRKCQEILDTGFEPDKMFVLDICRGMDDNHYLLEVNAFSTAGLYDCELDKIVSCASRLAWEEHQNYFKQQKIQEFYDKTGISK